MHLQLEPVNAVALWNDLGTRGPSTFPFGPGAYERVAGMMLFGSVAGIATALAERLAIAWTWDRSSSAHRMTWMECLDSPLYWRTHRAQSRLVV